MIEASELRIGNWVYDTRTVGEYGKAKTKMQVRFIDANSTYNYLEPIPITPEILQNAGFKGIDFKSSFLDGYIELDDEYKLEYDYGFNKFCINGMYLPVSPEYLHELQNLYNSLSKKELIINL